MIRAAVLGLVIVCLAAPRASADCAATCGDVCSAVPESAFFRVEVLSTGDGYATRVRIAERLGGATAITAAPGDELDDVYSQLPLAVGDSAIITISHYGGTPGEYVWNTAWPVRDDMVICNAGDPNVPVDQYVAMATSPDCAAVAEDLGVANTCVDTYSRDYCNAAGASPRPLLFAMVALAGACRRRRRRT